MYSALGATVGDEIKLLLKYLFQQLSTYELRQSPGDPIKSARS